MATITNRDWGRIRSAVLRVESGNGTGGPVSATPQFGASWPFGSRFSFGISIAGATVTVYPGTCYYKGDAYETTETTITLTANYLWIAVQIVPSESGMATCSVVRYDYSGAPQQHDGIFLFGLHKFEYVSGSAPYVNWARSCLGFGYGEIPEEEEGPVDPELVPRPCGHPGNEPGAGGASGAGDDTEHGGDDAGGGGGSGSGDNADHPGDTPFNPSTGNCEGET